MAKIPKTSNFLSRYLVTIVMIPSIVALHIGWNLMQKNESLVKEHETIDLPVITFYKYCLRKLATGDTQTKIDTSKTGSS